MTEFDPNNTGGGEQLPMGVLRGIALSSLVRVHRYVRGEVESSFSGFLINTEDNLQVATAGHSLTGPTRMAAFQVIAASGQELPAGRTSRNIIVERQPVDYVEDDIADDRYDEDIGVINLRLSPDELEHAGLRTLRFRDFNLSPFQNNEQLLGAGYSRQNHEDLPSIYAGRIVSANISDRSVFATPKRGFMKIRTDIESDVLAAGTSGGPWIDRYGQVVGLTVSDAQDSAEADVVARIINGSASRFFRGALAAR